MSRKRTAIAGLVLGASALVGLVAHEGYTDKAIIPTKGDRPTVGFGSTFRDDGSPVRMGDTITPQKALARSLAHIQKDELGIKRCVTAPLYQQEYDTMVDFAYQFGTGALCSSSMVSRANAGDYKGACDGYLNYRYMTSQKYIKGWEEYKPGRWRYDCSTPGNKICSGVWTRQLKRQADCMEVQ
jgi:lysozyme